MEYALKKRVQYPPLSSAIPYVIVLIFATFTLRVLLAIHEDTLFDFIDVIEGVLSGRPRGLAFQNRLMGPFLVRTISDFGFSMNAALRIFFAASLSVLFLMNYFLMRQIGMRVGEALSLVLLLAFLLCSLQFYWFHVWDLIDLIIFTIFGFLAIMRVSLIGFVLLFVVALLNRESALFIPVYMVLFSFYKAGDCSRRSLLKVDMLWFSAGVLMAIAGAAYTYLVRVTLFISLPDGSDDYKAEVLGNEIHSIENIRQFFWGNIFSPDIAITVSIVLCTCYFSYGFRNLAPQAKALFLTFLVILTCIMVFGIVVETRNFLILTPILIFLYVSRATEVARRALEQPVST